MRCAGRSRRREDPRRAYDFDGIGLVSPAVGRRLARWWLLESLFSMDGDHPDPTSLTQHQARGGYLYIDEVNLLEDHLVDLLLDVAASGENVVEREGLSIRHPARFVLVGSGNPEEGELRPQLLDRFGRGTFHYFDSY